jgi:hypothetical protein
VDGTRVVGGEASSATVLPPSKRFRLAFAKSRVLMLARNHGREPTLSGPSPGKPRVLSNRSSNPRRSGTAWDPRSRGGFPPCCGKTSLGWGEAVWPPRESWGPEGLLLGGPWVRPSVRARGGAGSPPASPCRPCCCRSLWCSCLCQSCHLDHHAAERSRSYRPVRNFRGGGQRKRPCRVPGRVPRTGLSYAWPRPRSATELELPWFTCKRSKLSPVLDALRRGAEREVSPSLINSAATCRAVACLLTELEEEEEEDPAGGFGLPADFPASMLTILLFLCLDHSCSPFSHCTLSLSIPPCTTK